MPRSPTPTTRSPTCSPWPSAYRDNALENPHLYAVMFGATSLKGFSLAEDDMEVGLHTPSRR